MHNGVAAVMESRISVKKAAKTFSVPRTTLIDRLKTMDCSGLIKVQLNRDKLVDAAVEAANSGRAAKMCSVPERTEYNRMNGSSAKNGKTLAKNIRAAVPVLKSPTQEQTNATTAEGADIVVTPFRERFLEMVL